MVEQDGGEKRCVLTVDLDKLTEREWDITGPWGHVDDEDVEPRAAGTSGPIDIKEKLLHGFLHH